MIGARGLRRAEVQFGKEVGEELAGAFAKRLRNSLPPNSTFGRWGAEEFVVMLSMKKSEAMASGKWITEHLSGAYACMKDGKTVRPSPATHRRSGGHVANEKPERILERIGVFLVSQALSLLMSGLMTGGFVAAHHQVDHAQPGAFRVFELAEKGDVFRAFSTPFRQTPESKAVVGKIRHLLLGPLLRVGEIGQKIVDHSGNRGAAFGVHTPKIHASASGRCGRW